MKNITLLAILAFSLVAASGMDNDARMNMDTDMGTDETVREEIMRLVNENLKYGDSNEKIIRFFESQNWVHTYDDIRKRYQTLGNLPEQSRHVSRYQIWIYVDDSKSFSSVDVEVFVPIPPP